ncbi:DHA2 family efflux MFS transporter permease subunit [Nocardia sp. NPDC006630]|uniref:DHA2 family efflux MFS transporter permease subunit n=1 Tax=Nocardia sp. NPDC006630 TaxID=3157181 RepID=UPI0033A074E0
MSSASDYRIPPEVRSAAFVIVLGAIATLLDSTVVNIAIRSLSIDLHTDLDTIQWVITGYLLALAACIPVTGWAAKRFGDRRLYLSTLILFAAGSLLCAMARTPGQLIAFRVIQGLGGGMVLPAGQIILAKLAGPQNMAKVMPVLGIAMVLTPVLGPTLGGLLLEGPGWRWLFLINLPICAAAVFAGRRLLPAHQPEEAGALDIAGLLLVSGGSVGVTYALAEVGSSGQASGSSMTVLAAGVVLLVVFVLRGLRIDHPLLDLRLYRNRAFSAAALATFCLGGALYGAMILMPLYFQTVRGQSAIMTGILLAPSGIGAAIAMPLAGRLSQRWGGGITASIGGLVTMLATIPFVVLSADTSYGYLLGAMGVRGLGIGLSMMPAMTAAYQVLGRDKINDATPQLSMLQRVGGSVGTAVVAVALQHQLSRSHTPEAMAAGFGAAFWWVLGISIVTTLSAVLLALAERPALRLGAISSAGAGAGLRPGRWRR